MRHPNNSKVFLFAPVMVGLFLLQTASIEAGERLMHPRFGAEISGNSQSADERSAPSTVNGITAKVADLSIVSVRIEKHASKCKDGHALFSIIATVKNVGTGRLPDSVTSAADTHTFPNTNPWGAGAPTPALGPGQPMSISIPINYHHNYKDHIGGFHQFKVTANDWGYKNKKGENNFSNNVKTVSVNLPKETCGHALAEPTQPGNTESDIRMKGKKVLQN